MPAKNVVPIKVRVHPDKIERLRERAKQEKVSMSELVRRGLDKVLLDAEQEGSCQQSK